MPSLPSPRRWTLHRWRALLRATGRRSARFRRRLAVLAAAIAIGVAAVLFATAADAATRLFERIVARWPLAPLAGTPLAFAGLAWLTQRLAPLAGGSGIPQVIAASQLPEDKAAPLISVRTACAKAVLLIGAILAGASTGREGPTVQVAAAIMRTTHRLFRLDLRPAVIVASGAAGVAAAFNTPLAGLLFAIEELAAAYEQRVTLLVLSAIVIAGMTAQAVQGSYVYFGVIGARMAVRAAIVAVPVAGLLGGIAGGLFSRAMLALSLGGHPVIDRMRSRAVLFAAGCGLVVAAIGVLTGTTWGTGYAAARETIAGGGTSLWFGPAKWLATLATAVAGMPGGIFAPSLAVGAGVGSLVHTVLPSEPTQAIVILGMVAYFAGVVRAPLTAVVILSETTASHDLLLPMFAAAFIADATSQRICPEKLYHGLAKPFRSAHGAAPPAPTPLA